MSAPVVVVGGGAAGLIAAWRSALAGQDTLLLEANPRTGVKVRISGGGKCNVTHAGPLREVLAAFPAPQARFLRAAFHAFSNTDVIELLRREGVETYARPDGRVFPLDRPGSAQLVVEALQGLAAKAGARLEVGIRVEGLDIEERSIVGVRIAGGRIAARTVILATGGASYPRTGTRGDALGWLADLGLPVKRWFPALAPIPLLRPRPGWEGVAFRGGELRLRDRPDGPIRARSAGDIVFTRSGISGPAALDLSEQVEQSRREGGAFLEYSFVKSLVVVEKELLDRAVEQPDASLRRWLGNWLPDRVTAARIDEWNVPVDLRLSRLSKAARKTVLRDLDGFLLGAPAQVPLELGEVCAGGLDLGSVDPRTMAVRGWGGLRVCGELLDVNGPVGGYNLQAAFSTGFVAGNSR